MEAGNKQSTQTNKSEKSEDIVEGRIKINENEIWKKKDREKEKQYNGQGKITRARGFPEWPLDSKIQSIP